MEIKFEIKLKAKEPINGYKTGETVIIVNPIFDRNIGIAFFPIDKNFDIVYQRQFTGLKDKAKKEVYELDIYSEMDEGRKLLFVVTWINEYAAFAMLTPEEFNEYKKIGVEVIEKGFEGFYVQLHRESFQKMNYEGNVYENPELL